MCGTWETSSKLEVKIRRKDSLAWVCLPNMMDGNFIASLLLVRVHWTWILGLFTWSAEELNLHLLNSKSMIVLWWRRNSWPKEEIQQVWGYWKQIEKWTGAGGEDANWVAYRWWWIRGWFFKSFFFILVPVIFYSRDKIIPPYID